MDRAVRLFNPLHPLVSDPLLVTGGMDRAVRMFNPYIPSSVTHSS